MRTLRHRIVVLSALLLARCASPRPSELPRDEPWLVVVKSARLPRFAGATGAFAHHTWIDVKCGGEDAWRRVEVAGRSSGALIEPVASEECRADLWQTDRSVHVLGVVTGDAARRIAEALPPAVAAHGREYADGYRRWPGPNSNTFVAELARAIPDLAFVADPNAIGKDWDGWCGAGLTNSKTGVRVDTAPLGFALGAKEGVELHLLGLTLGVSFWPPGIELPFLPRLPGGLATELRDGMAAPPPAEDVAARFDWDPGEPIAETRVLPLRGGLVLHDRASGAWSFVAYKVRVPAQDPCDDPWHDEAPGSPVPEDAGEELDVEIARHGMEHADPQRLALPLGPARRAQVETILATRTLTLTFRRIGADALTLEVAGRAP